MKWLIEAIEEHKVFLNSAFDNSKKDFNENISVFIADMKHYLANLQDSLIKEIDKRN